MTNQAPFVIPRSQTSEDLEAEPDESFATSKK